MPIWCISFMVLMIFGRRMWKSFKRFMLLLYMPPHTHVEMTVRGATCHPCAFIASSSGLYSSFFVCMACFIY